MVKKDEDKKEPIQNNYSLAWLYKGLTTNLLSSMLSYAIYFYWHSLLNQYFRSNSDTQKLSTWEIFMVTSLAGIIATSITNPLWFINTRVSLCKDVNKGVI
jgi:hypothetical protein